MTLSSRSKLSEQVLASGFVLVLCLVSVLSISPVAAQRICTPCEHCDQNGDGILRETNRCLNKCPDDSVFQSVEEDGPACSGDPITLSVALTEGGFDFTVSPQDFALRERGDQAQNDEFLVLVPVAVGEEPPAWDEVFAACPGLFPDSTSYPSALSIGAGDATIQKSAGDIRIMFSVAGVTTGVGAPADITVQLIGQTDPLLVLPQVPGATVAYTLDMIRIWGRTVRMKGSKGERLRCGGSEELDLPAGITPSLLEVTASSP